MIKHTEEYYQQVIDLCESVEWMIDTLIDYDDPNTNHVQYISSSLLDEWEEKIKTTGEQLLKLNRKTNRGA